MPPLRALLPIALLVVLLGAGGIYTAINLPHQCGLFGAARHGLLCEAPLPANAVYQRDGSAFGIHDWIFTADSASYQSLHDFFTAQLPANGWRCVQDDSDVGSLPGSPIVSVTGLIAGVQSGNVLSVTFVYGTLTTPSPQTSDTSLAQMQIIYGVAAAPASTATLCLG